METMPVEDEERPVARAHVVGEDLARHSVRELEALKTQLAAEIERVEAEIARKGATRSAADSLFKT
jgi:uncharacterized small protein (DUF1192 family)